MLFYKVHFDDILNILNGHFDDIDHLSTKTMICLSNRWSLYF